MNNDLISRKWLTDAIRNRRTYLSYEDAKDVIDLIDNAPTVEPFEPDYVGAERLKARQRGYEDGYRNGIETGKTLNPKIKQGEWKYSHISSGYFCDKCEKYSRDKTNFCSNCGAKMKGGAE